MPSNKLTWASDDLARAARLYERVLETGEPVDERWQTDGSRWRLIARNGGLQDGSADAYLTAHRSSPRSSWRFNWRDGAWSVVRHVEFIG